MDLGGASVSGPRPYNEDTFAYRDLSAYSAQLGGLEAFFMVSDGMGGHQSGDVASRIARETADAYIDDLLGMAANNQLSVEPALALQEIVSEANAAVLRAAADAGGSSMGATFVGGFASKTRAWIGHVGDSRAYLLRRGAGKQLTVDHSQVGRLISEGVLTEEQAQSHPQRNVIDRALGFSGSDAEVDIVDLEPGDAIVLCSDGLSTVLAGEDIAAVAALSKSAQSATANLVEEAVRYGTDDNATAVVWAEDWSLFRSTSPIDKANRKQASAARRASARHSNAQKSTLWIAGAMGIAVVALAVVAVMSMPSGGSSSLQPPKGSSGTARAGTARVSTPTADPAVANRELQGNARLRVASSTKAAVVAMVASSKTLPVRLETSGTLDPRTKKLWYEVKRDWLSSKWPTGTRVLVLKNGYKSWQATDTNWPEKVWVNEEALVPQSDAAPAK
jgi:PPM family protein phosphatase